MATTHTVATTVDSASVGTTTIAASTTTVSLSADDLTAKAVHKRYEGLVTVRAKAIKGKGAWYWTHLEPILVRNSDTGLAKAVKLRCSLCDAVFSASNPSRTASEHLKRGTCPNFSSVPKPISSILPSPLLPSPSSSSQHQNHRKRSSSSSGGGGVSVSYQTPSSTHLALVDPSRYCSELVGYNSSMAIATPVVTPPLMLSGGKEDLGALAMLEDSVKKLKSPRSSAGPTLSKTQIDSALNLLTDWLYESCGAVSFSSVENPKFKAFLNQVGLPTISRRELAGSRLDAKFEEVRSESEARIRDAMFFQIASDGWKTKNFGLVGGEKLVNLSVNLPNGTSVFHKAVFTSGPVPSKYAEGILWETVSGISGNVVRRCVGIVSDKFKSKALRNLENQNHWMVNLTCQLQGFTSLIKDCSKELQLFKTVTTNCLKVVNFINSNHQVRNSFHKYQLQELDHAELLRVPPIDFENTKNYVPVYAMMEDIWTSARALEMVVLDDSYKVVCVEDPIAREVADMIRDMGFWTELEAVHCLVKLIKEMAQEIEVERPLVGQCLPLWEELRVKAKDWCVKFNIAEGPLEKVIEKRFRKNYHPAWSAAFILDPLYLMRDTSGKYLPPFKCLTPEQEKDVDRLITRLVSREEAHIALMELMKWRSEGLDPLYAQAVQVKQRDPMSGKMKIANPQSSRLVWETCLSEFKALGKVAVRLIFLHATSCGFKCNWSFLRWVCTHGHSRFGMDRAQKMIFIAAHAKLERREFSSEEDKDAELFTMSNGEDDVLNKVFVDASSV
ncbi:Proline-rich receptor-like protein kinase [Thalictrum thalictroides]|uniref:Proline-rich receptor-like protein kinase n=1 Tax=Thalictrum thalictroides TaxID=46969 RepID=A0A7J6W2Y1_THATH|nr:Proline-rich receptor-like protein kinase [Thalictrum thalictroides]